MDSEKAKELLELGAVYVDRIRATGDKEIKEGAYLRVHCRPRRFEIRNADRRRLVFFENQDFLIANKPKDLPTHATLDNAKENLLYLLASHGQVLLTHRLDQFTSGLMVFAKTAEFQRRFSHWLSRGLVRKEYIAWTEHALAPGRMVDFMDPTPAAPRKLSPQPLPGWKICELEVLACENKGGRGFRSRILLGTGRTHQIRAQLAARGCPILGDALYGSKLDNPVKPSLTAAALAFPRDNRSLWYFRLC